MAAHQDTSQDGPSSEVRGRFNAASDALKAAILASRPHAEASLDQPNLFAVVATARIGDWIFLVSADPDDGQLGDPLLTPTPASLFV